MATKRLGNDCYEKAGEDEAVFTLRATDRTADIFVDGWAIGQVWARERRAEGMTADQIEEEMRHRIGAAFPVFTEPTPKEQEAFDTAIAMRNSTPRKWAD